MGAKLDKGGLAVTSNVFVSCSMFPQAKMLAEAGVGADIEEIFGGPKKELFPAAEYSAFAGETITAETAIDYFGSKLHYEKIKKGTQSGLWLPKDPPELMLFFHLVLPLRDGVYENEGISLPLRNLLPVGKPGRNQVAHLGLVFDSHCDDEAIENLLAKQAAELGNLLSVMRELPEFDFAEFRDHFEHIEKGIKLLGL